MLKIIHPFTAKENPSRSLSKCSAWLVYLAIVAIYAMSLFALTVHRQDESMWSVSDVLPILKYSVLQAGLSAILTCMLGVLLARAFLFGLYRKILSV